MDVNEMIKELAAGIGIHASDLLCMAQSIANSIQQDKAADAYIAADQETQIEFVQAYADVAKRKFAQFQTAYLTSERGEFNRALLDMCKEIAA